MPVRFAGLVLLFAPTAFAASPVVQLIVEPAQITLTHAGDRHRIVVDARFSDGTLRDLTREAKYSTTDPAIVVVSPTGAITPKSAGQTVIRVEAAGHAATVSVRVSGVAKKSVSFANDVMPLLTKVGCNQGACHGAASGKKGFKVSLRGYDPASDFIKLTRGTDGRRINRIEPESSLLILKPAGVVPHEGGKHFDRDSEAASLLARWVREGATSDVSTAPALTDLEVFPKFATFAEPGHKQQLLVLARFTDGTVRDVTTDARYSSSNENAATVNENGLVSLPNKGEAAVTARYGSKIAISTLVSVRPDPGFRWPNPPEVNAVDQHVFAKLRQMQIVPSELCTDFEFLRRISLDLLGIPPTADEVRSFLADRSPDKRARKIDQLLERPEHAEFWALKWCDLLKVKFDTHRDRGTWGLYRWVRDAIAANMPFNRFVRELVMAEGSCADHPAANYYRSFATADDASEGTVQVFLGIRLMCAKCHDHPFEKWVQTDYYGMMAFFQQVGRKRVRQDDLIVFRQEVVPQAAHPNTGQPVAAKLLDGPFLKLTASEDARARLAEWMTRKDNQFMPRATVNRLWSHLFGKGIIDPVDDIRSSNPPSNGPLLEALTREFIDHDFDVRHILRMMLNSRTYQLSARTNPSNVDDTTNFSHRIPRRLTAEQLLDSISQATGVPERYRSRFGGQTVSLPAVGVRAGSLPDRQLSAETLDLFGRPRGESVCSCERNDEASMTQALHLINGKSLGEKLLNGSGHLARLAQNGKIPDELVIDELYLVVLSRLPSASESAVFKHHFASAGTNRLLAAQDAMWALFNTREFLFNH